MHSINTPLNTANQANIKANMSIKRMKTTLNKNYKTSLILLSELVMHHKSKQV